MNSVSGKISTGGFGGGLKMGNITPASPGAPSRVGTSPGGANTSTGGSAISAFQLPGVNSSQTGDGGSGMSERYATAEGQGAQNFAGTGIQAGGGGSKGAIDSDKSKKMGLEGLSSFFKGLGTAMTEAKKMLAKKDEGEGGQDQAAQQDAMMMAQQNNGMDATA